MNRDPLKICPDSFVAFAERLADAARPLAKRYFRSGIAADAKSDSSPVTKADREIEETLRAMILAEHADHGIRGEEFGIDRGDADYLWVLDPIDGTKSFTIGMPTFGTLIALLHRGVPILGVIDQPISAERWVGAAGRATTFNGVPVSARNGGDIGQAVLACTAPGLIGTTNMDAFKRVEQAVRYPVWGGDCYIYGLLASGHLDLVIEAGLKPHDWSALIPVIEGAGGVITDWRGQMLTLESDGRVLAAGGRILHEAAVHLLAG